MIKTSIVIPSWNGLKWLEDCVNSIRRYTPESHELIVVDNGSSDGTADFCISEKIVFISLSHPAGFPAACNMGLNLASGDALLLLNNDTLATPHWLSNMLACLYSREDVGIVGPMTNYASGAQQITVPFTNVQEMAEQMNRSDPAKWREVERVVGFCLLFKRELSERIGLLDERFSPGHYEDDDFCYRARLQGFRILIAGDVFVYHHGSATFSVQPEMQQQIEANRLKFIEKWGVDPRQRIA